MVSLLPFKYTGPVKDENKTCKNQSSLCNTEGMNILHSQEILKADLQIRMYRQYEEI